MLLWVIIMGWYGPSLYSTEAVLSMGVRTLEITGKAWGCYTACLHYFPLLIFRMTAEAENSFPVVHLERGSQYHSCYFMEKYEIEMGTSWQTTNSSTTYTKIFKEKHLQPTRFFNMTSLKKAHHHHTNPFTKLFGTLLLMIWRSETWQRRTWEAWKGEWMRSPMGWEQSEIFTCKCWAYTLVRGWNRN